MFYSTTDLNHYTKNVSANNYFMNSPDVEVGDFFADCAKQDLYNISLVGTPENVQPFYDFFSKYFLNVN
jgi:hypothetical protein